MSFDVFEAGGMLWPRSRSAELDSQVVKKYIDAAHDMDRAIQAVPKDKRKVVVQAGGHCGGWPLYLSRFFENVYTFEPTAANFYCLARNVAHENVFAARGMLGCVRKTQDICVSQKWIGSHHGRPNLSGPIPVYRIDDLGLQRLDLLVLDVEGMELPALRGAEFMLMQHRPPVMVEDRGLGERFGFGSFSSIKAVLGALGYQEAWRVKRDVVFLAA